MERKEFMKTVGLTALVTPSFSLKDVSNKKNCLAFDLSHYKFNDDQLRLSEYTFSGYRVLKTNIEVPHGTLIYQKTINDDNRMVSEVWSIVNEEYQQTHTNYYFANQYRKSYRNFATNVSVEINVPLN